MEVLRINQKGLLLLIFMALIVACIAPQNKSNRELENKKKISNDSVYINNKVLLNDTILLRRSFTDKVCYVSRVSEEFGYPNYHITCKVDDSSVVFLEDDDSVWVYQIHLKVPGQLATVENVSYEVGASLVQLISDSFAYDSSALSLEQIRHLDKKEYNKIEQLRFPFDIPDYLIVYAKKGEVVVFFKNSIVSEVLINFYTEGYFD